VHYLLLISYLIGYFTIKFQLFVSVFGRFVGLVEHVGLKQAVSSEDMIDNDIGDEDCDDVIYPG